jgi:hypothetical protein
MVRGGAPSLLGKSAATIPPNLPPLDAPPGQLGVVQAPGKIGFTLNGVLRWLIDISQFAGKPTLTTKTRPQQATVITLAGARFPGTQLPADFVLTVQKATPFGTPADIKFTLGGFHAQMVLESWLAGAQVMQSQVALSGDVCPLGMGSKLVIGGAARARFFPTWLFQMGGTDIATISGLGPDLPGASFSIQLRAPGDPGISIHPKPKRTLLTMLPGATPWNLKPSVTALPIGNLTVADGLFGRIDIEAGEGAAGDAARELMASSTRADGLALAVAGGITNLNGNPFSLPLVLPTYAIAFDPTPDHSQGDQTFLTSRFTSSPVWLAASGFALQVGDATFALPFEADTAKGNVTSVRCQPALFLAAAPLESGPSENLGIQPLPVAPGATLPFVETPGPTPGWGILAAPEIAGKRRLSLPDLSLSVVRREDLLSLEFLFYNLALEAGGGNPSQLARKDSSKPAYLVAQFNAPQNIAEQAYLESYTDPGGHPAPPGSTGQNLTEEKPGSPGFPLPSQTRAAGPSRLAFRLPNGTDTLAFSLDNLLNWAPLEQSVTPVAQMPDPKQTVVPAPPPISPPPAIRAPLATETAIEMPWRLFLSPNYSGAWAHSRNAVTLGGRTELWHTRLAVRKQQGAQAAADESIPRRVRAVWSPDYSPGAIPPHAPPYVQPQAPFRMSLDPDDRDQIVRLSSDFNMNAAGAPINFPPVSIAADKLYLTSLGAWIDVLGDWGEPLPAVGNAVFSVEQWRHRGTMARDNYVRVVYAGYLLPFGHRASLVKITERKFQSIDSGPTTAFLRQRFFIIVREPEKSYSFLSAAQQRALPYQKIRLTTLVTPDVVPALDPVTHRYSFFPTTGPNTFFFHITGVDWEGRTSEFTAPLYFVERGENPTFANAVIAYNGSNTGTRDLSGQNVAFAASTKSGDTSLHARTLTFSAQPAAPSPTSANPFFPRMEGASVVVPSIQQLTGGSGEMDVQYYAPYVTSGLGVGEVFFQKSGSPLAVGFNGKQSGGVATPNLQVSGISRKFGTVSGATPDKVATGDWQNADIFADVGAKLFGVISLADLIDAVAGAASTAPVVLTERSSTEIRTKLLLTPVVHQNYSALGFINLTFNGDLTKALQLNATIVAQLSGGSSEVTIHGELNNFTLSLAKVIGITINQIAFDAPAGQKLTVSVKMPPTDDNGPLLFLGDLSFLNELRKYIPSDGFQDPPSLDVTADGITAGYSLPIPSIGVGVFSIENIKLSASLTLPFFTPNPIRFRFAFSEREHPFLITVSLLGGGGFFGLVVGPDGVEMLEASIEVGANVSIDVVVASGNLHIMAGVYLKLDFVSKSSQLTGYLRAGGSVDVLGLISASVEFYLGFTYYFGPPCKIAGEATITIEVHVLFFSASVSASLRREFADPKATFADLIGPSDWDYYCDSFAAA